MWRALIITSFLVLPALAQTSGSGFFRIQHAKKQNFVIPEAQMQEAEKLYLTTCATVQREFQSREELRPHLLVVLGASRDELGVDRKELWLKQWNPTNFAQAVVVMAFEEMLTRERRVELTLRALHRYNATIDVANLKRQH